MTFEEELKKLKLSTELETKILLLKFKYCLDKQKVQDIIIEEGKNSTQHDIKIETIKKIQADYRNRIFERMGL